MVATQATPWADLENQRCGWWVLPNLAAIEGALKEALTLPDQDRAQMGAAGRAWMILDFSPDAVTTRMLEAYGRIIRRNKGRS